jgi:hypothetical protein
MRSQPEQVERVEVLRGLIERLSAPDLTLAEAAVLRGRLSDLLERDERPSRRDQAHPAPPPASCCRMSVPVSVMPAGCPT